MPPTKFQRAVEHFARPHYHHRHPIRVRRDPWWDRDVPVKGWTLAVLLVNAVVGFGDLVGRALS